MKKTNLWFKAAVCGALLIVGFASACGEDEDVGGAGSGGSSGQGGSAGKGGSSGSGGTAGTGGSAGTAGTGGSAGDAGDAKSDAAEALASAELDPRSGSSVTGSAVFTKNGNVVTLTLTVQGAGAAGKRGVHIHQNGECGAADGGATEAGGHWNPADASHGAWDAASHHLGDVGNIDIGSDGKGTLTFSTDAWTIGSGQDNDVVGHAIVVHQIEDALKPDAALGARVACGVIENAASGDL